MQPRMLSADRLTHRLLQATVKGLVPLLYTIQDCCEMLYTGGNSILQQLEACVTAAPVTAAAQKQGPSMKANAKHSQSKL